MVGALVWPITSVIAIVVLRRQLTGLIQGPVSRLKAGPAGVELEWDRKASELREEIGDGPREEPRSDAPTWLPLPEELRGLAGVAPDAVVLESYARIEQQLQAMLVGVDLPLDRPAGAAALAQFAEQRGLITHETRDAVEGLSVLRNLAVHGRTSVDSGRALDFAAMTDAVLYSMRRSAMST
jgi:hypothetical protein